MGDIVRSDPEGSLTVEQFALHMVKSRFYRHLTDPSQAIAQVAMGQALGLPAITAITGVHVIEGKPSLGVHLISGIIKRSGKYTYRVLAKSAQECKIEFRERVDGKWETIGVESFTMQQAQRAGLAGKQNWKNYPEAMLFSRAMAAGARTHCPDIFLGGVYVPEEIPSTNPNNIHPESDPDDPSTIIETTARPATMPEIRAEEPKAPVAQQVEQKAAAPQPRPVAATPGKQCDRCFALPGKKHTKKCGSGFGDQIVGQETPIADPFEEKAEEPILAVVVEETEEKPYELGGDLLSNIDVTFKSSQIPNAFR